MALPSFPDVTTPITLAGRVGAIEAIVEWPVGIVEPVAVAVVCHPHPLHGGTMTNKVVTSAAQAYRECGAVTVRFNFRGVGQSAGTHDHGSGEGDDLVAIVEWLRAERPHLPLWLAGFSFGAYVSMMRAAEIAPQHLVSIAPPVGRWSFDTFVEPACPWCVIQPDADEVVDPQAVYRFVAARATPPQLVRIAEASHFFHGKLLALREAIRASVRGA